MTEFIGPGTPLTDNGLSDILQSAGLKPAEIWSVVSVETSGCGYLRDRRPKILFERHVFSRLTGHQFDDADPDISQRTAGGYGPSGSNQFDRLNAAIQLDRPAALKSASWGIGQIMGENFGPAGFTDVDAMVKAMVASEDNQLRAMVAFLDAQKIIGTLRRTTGPASPGGTTVPTSLPTTMMVCSSIFSSVTQTATTPTLQSVPFRST
jgi:hypothetical protein